MYLFIDYQKEVVDKYKKMLHEQTLARRLMIPTPASLKEECLVVCQTRFKKTDLGVLTAFFGPATDQATLLDKIDHLQTDKFKSLQKFLKGATTKPDPQIVEMVAWLIDFEQRPFVVGMKSKVKETNSTTEGPTAEIIPGIDQETPELPEPVTIAMKQSVSENAPSATAVAHVDTTIAPKQRKRYRVMVAIGLALLSLGIAGWWYQDRSSGKPNVYMSSGPQLCMFWAGDHYQGINCNQKLKDTLVVAMDSVRLNGFRKVTEMDTVTEQSIGHLWYAKIDGMLELYTADGNHPDKPNVRLRPLTEYMYNKYIRK